MIRKTRGRTFLSKFATWFDQVRDFVRDTPEVLDTILFDNWVTTYVDRLVKCRGGALQRLVPMCMTADFFPLQIVFRVVAQL